MSVLVIFVFRWFGFVLDIVCFINTSEIPRLPVYVSHSKNPCVVANEIIHVGLKQIPARKLKELRWNPHTWTPRQSEAHQPTFPELFRRLTHVTGIGKMFATKNKYHVQCVNFSTTCNSRRDGCWSFAGPDRICKDQHLNVGSVNLNLLVCTVSIRSFLVQAIVKNPLRRYIYISYLRGWKERQRFCCWCFWTAFASWIPSETRRSGFRWKCFLNTESRTTYFN